MSDNEAIRRFFRREADELTEHDRIFGPHLRIGAYHIFASLISDPEIELSNLTNFDDGYSDPPIVSVRWESCAVGFEETRQFVTTGYAFVVHRGLRDLKFIIALIPDSPGVKLRLIVRSDDIDDLATLLDWVDELEKTNHPLNGKLFSLAKTRLDFLPDQKVDRDDVIMPTEVLDEIERNFSFLDDPEGFPAPLRHRAILLAGQPGVGKTMIAKWLSGRFCCTGLWVTPGALWELGASAVFDLARRLKPTLLILEDLDVATGDRKGNQPLGDLLGQMDGFVDLGDIAVIATTNCPEVIDAALDPEKRPGRFHRLFTVPPPDAEGRRRLLRLVLSQSTVILEMPSVTFDQLVRGTDRKTGAQLTEIVRDIESRLLWGRRRNEDPSVVSVVEEMDLGQLKSSSGLGFAVCRSAS
ncbi:MAG: AAA family ATPase [Thermoanaerobaculales bacterium]|nr:AAA family ATPase [Thermoanaerobaculales bacterium]